MSNLNEQDIAEWLDNCCKHCTHNRWCTIFNTECTDGYCGVKDQ